MEIWGTDGSTLDGIDNIAGESIDLVASGNTIRVGRHVNPFDSTLSQQITVILEHRYRQGIDPPARMHTEYLGFSFPLHDACCCPGTVSDLSSELRFTFGDPAFLHTDLTPPLQSS